MTILLLPIFLFGLVISWIVYLGVLQANESALASPRIPAAGTHQQAEMVDEPVRVIAQQR
ncbi:MAG: hypothetical protein ACPGVU_14530 [Limisphaerales bacterium]|jgi:hypothetical protein